jgi:hypothetical protein
MDYLVEQLRFELREDPSSRVFFRLGEHLRREGELEEAVGILRAGLEHHPRYVAAWVSLGRALLESGDDRGASEALARALELDPENGVAARHAGEAAIAGGEWVAAIKALKRARALSGQDDALDARILFVEQRLAENGQLEVPAPAPRRTAPPPPAAAERVFPVDDAASGAHRAVGDVFEPAPEAGDAAAAEAFDMDSRRTMAIPLDQIPIAPPPPPAAEAEAVFDLGGGEEPAPELEIVPEAGPVPEPEAVFETADRADDSAFLEAGLAVGAVFETGTVAADWEAASDGDADGDDDELSSRERRPEELPLPTMTLARLALDQGDLELAEKTLRGVLARNAGHSEASSLLATLTGGAVEGAPPPPAADEPGTARVQALRRWLDAVRLASERLKT